MISGRWARASLTLVQINASLPLEVSVDTLQLLSVAFTELLKARYIHQVADEVLSRVLGLRRWEQQRIKFHFKIIVMNILRLIFF